MNCFYSYHLIVFVIVPSTMYKLGDIIEKSYRRQWRKRYETAWKRFMENIINRSYIKRSGNLCTSE